MTLEFYAMTSKMGDKIIIAVPKKIKDLDVLDAGDTVKITLMKKGAE